MPDHRDPERRLPDGDVPERDEADHGVADPSLVETRHGPARLIRSPAQQAWATLVLGHGAGGRAQARDLGWLARDLPPTGITVVRMEQPWRVAGGKVASRTQVLDESWMDALTHVGASRLVVGGRSAGARVACRTATSAGAVACLALAFPLHPPWHPETSRIAELHSSGVPTLVVQGDRDEFGAATAFPVLPGSIRIATLAGADHQFSVPRGSGRTSAMTRADLVGHVLGWLHEMIPAT